jgi:hypothetical protein
MDSEMSKADLAGFESPGPDSGFDPAPLSDAFELAAVAHHEASHATVARAIGLRVRGVRLGDVVGHPGVEALVSPQTQIRYPRTRDGRRCNAVVSFAGPISEAKFRGLRAEDIAPWWSGPWRGDLDNLHGLDHDVGMFAPLHRAAEALVDELWPQIEAVADALIERRTLTALDVVRLMKQPRVLSDLEFTHAE